jgi:HNH endonuclease
MSKCIFCKSTDGPFGTREHILPESLGGGDWAILPPGRFCDSCQNRFGSSIEQQALADYPFSMLRVFLGIPTKKGKAPWLDSWEGKIQAGPIPGQLSYEPASPFISSFNDGTKTQLRILAEPRKPSFICRTLLKMALEVVGATNAAEVFAEKFDEARHYALTGEKTKPWWYLQCEDHESFSRLCQGKPEADDISVSLETHHIGDDAEVFYLRLYHLKMICPLESRIMPPPREESQEPAVRLFVV